MKTTTVPAQITTVEDKIAGNLSPLQLALMTAPIFFSGLLYVVFPPVLKLSGIKLGVSGLLLVVCLALAIRIRGKLVLNWLVMILRYNLRPRYYLFNKNDEYLRTPDQTSGSEPVTIDQSITKEPIKPIPLTELALPARVRLETAMADPRANFGLTTTRKGDLRVRITEIKAEG